MSKALASLPRARLTLLFVGLLLVVGLLLAAVETAHGQTAGPVRPSAFQTWRPSLSLLSSNQGAAGLRLEAERNRTRRVLIGGAIGAVVGFAACTAVSTITDDSEDGGLSFCPLDSSLLFGGGGFLVGAAVGWML